MLCLWQKKIVKQFANSQILWFSKWNINSITSGYEVILRLSTAFKKQTVRLLKSSLIAGVTGWAGTPKNVFMEQDSIRKIWKIRNLLSLRNDQTEVTFRHRTELKYVSAFYNRWQLTTCWKELRGISWSNLQAVSDVTQLYFFYIEAIKRPL